jgi:Ino eighty subunit 1
MDLTGIMNADEVDPNGHSNKEEVKSVETKAGSGETPSSSSKKGSSGHKRGGHNRMYHTLLTGTKLRHLKKKDGDPLWRKDIQYDFLYSIFYNEQRVFTNPYTDETGQTFADVYIDAMAKSSKTSKILREKLLGDRKASLNMAMVCLLVNIGRMNTTLNFFPEMKAQLRTYHPIPSLQCYTDQSDQYKQLQDAPRLKSILKGACEDRNGEPTNLEELAQSPWKPTTNPVNLIFILATYAPRVDEKFFADTGKDFFDLLMDETLSSESRGRAFLWLMWAYLESDLSPEALRSNPFGPGSGEDGLKVPEFKTLTSEEMAKENVDNEIEKEFGEKMTKERLDYIENTNAATLNAASAVLIDQNGSSPHPGTPTHNGASTRMRKRDSLLSNGSTSTPVRSLRHRDSVPDYAEASASDPFDEERKGATGKVKLVVKPPGSGRKGGKTSAMEARTRKCQAEIERILQTHDRRAKRARYEEGFVKRTWRRIKDLDPIYISDDESSFVKEEESTTKRGGKRKNQQQTQQQQQQPTQSTTQQISASTANGNGNITYSSISGGNGPNATTTATSSTANINVPTLRGGTLFSDDDYGEEALAVARALRRAIRWTNRWKQPANGSMDPPLQATSHHSDVMRLDNLIDPDGDVNM